jgi:hypothetical protein
MTPRALTMLVLTAVVALSGRVEAQQTGLFPRAPIRRQRMPCDQEDPTYKVYKQQYFGYHPTCWRTFPQGWGCPSTEAPDIEKSKKEIPPNFDRDLLDGAEDQGGERGAPMDRRPERAPIPDVDVFDEKAPAAGAPNMNPLPGRTPAPRQANPPAGGSPFDELNRPGPGAAMSRPRNGSRGTAAAAPPADEAPELSAPAAGTPAQGSAYRSRTRDADSQLAANAEDGPVLGLPDDAAPRGDDSSAGDPQAGPLGSYAVSDASAAAPTATAPAPAAQPRRRIFGNLFSSISSNWTRR